MYPFELYKKFASLKAHFNQLKFIYGYNRLKYITEDKFIKTKNKKIYDSLAINIDNNKAENLFISNLISNPNFSIYNVNKKAWAIYYAWEHRLKNIQKTFVSDIKKIVVEFNLHGFNDIKTRLFSIEHYNNIEISSFYTYMITSISPETVVILNYMMVSKYDFNFLQKAYHMKIEPRCNYLALLKYMKMINIKNIMIKNKALAKFQNLI